MAHNAKALRGVVPIIPTPFHPDSEEVNSAAIGPLIDFAIEAGAAGICLPAYASEFYKLTEAERSGLVEAAVSHAAGRIPVLAQSNHPSAKVACAIARANAQRGADIISFAVPRIFALGSEDLLRYCAAICDAVDIPVLIQDFNPGGPTIGADFCRRLADACPNFQYVKLEEALMEAKVTAIREATDDRVGVLEGWGGLYMLELYPYGLCGIMPGLGVADLLAHIWRRAEAGDSDGAMDIFEKICPQLMFSLQNMEMFLHVEKRLLVQRGLLADATVRQATLSPSPELLAYGDFLNGRVIQAARSLAA